MKTVTSEAQYKQYFSGSFQGMTSLIVDVLSPIFGKFTPTTDPRGVDYVDVYGNEGANIDHIYDYGKFYTDNTDVSVFEVVLSERCHISRARKGIRKAVGRITEKYSGAFIVFHYPEGSANAEAQTWRLSWLKRLDVHRDDSPAKRYTYLCGPDYSCRTIAQRFETLYKEKNKTLDSITKAFDAEALSEEFFKEYKVLYDDIVQWITGQRVIREGRQWKEEGSFRSGNGKDICDDFLKEFENIESQEEKEKQASKAIRDYVKKMLGRLVFIQFLQKKGYLGIDGKTTQNFLLDLFNCITDEQKDNFIDTALEQVVYLLLNSDDRKPGSEVINNHTLEVPFLNGGLFERDKWDEKNVKLPKEFFHNEQYVDEKRDFRDTELRPNDRFLTQCGILDLFNHYNFTIDENDPNDAEVGVDPEMLGKIFENLLEDNKEKGAFYTPKEIVQYMCKESLIAYLCTKVTGHDDDIRAFVDNPENGNVPEKDKVLDALKDVKICDPAIGSGAFPMGLLNLLVALREKLEPSKNRCDLKKDIIQNNIYGVDIEKGAIDIARLRFWLSIMVDEDVDEKNPQPTPLPNFDYKFMQGNSLVESFAGHDLSHILDNNETSSSTSKSKKFNPNQTGMDFSSDDTRQNLRIWLSKYFSLSDHNEKDRYRELINESVKNYIIQQGLSSEEEKKLANLNPSANQDFFLWHTWFKDIFDNGNFDIVIGNPPYIRQELLGMDYKRKLIDAYPEVGNGIADICVYFFGLGIRILNSNGVLSFITSNKFLKTKYGKELRHTLTTKVSVDRIIDFFELPVFNASTDAGITILFKSILNNTTKYYPIKTLVNLNLTEITSGSYLTTIKNDNEWQFVEDSQSSILDKLNFNTISLKEFTNNKIFYGIKTGFNKAFVIKDKTIAQRLLNSESAPIIKKYAQSTDIQMWGLKNDNKFFIATGYDTDIECLYPTAFQYLSQFRDELESRCDKGVKFYNLRACAYYEEFEKPKLIYIHTAKDHQFYFDMEGHYINNSCYMIVTDSKFLFCFLNSKLFKYYKRLKFVAYGDGQEAGRCKLDYNKMITVPIKKNVEEKPFEELYEKIKKIKKANPNADTSSLEREIDILVYQLYNLTPEEIAIIEKSTKTN